MHTLSLASIICDTLAAGMAISFLSRREFLVSTATAALVTAAPKSIPLGLELFSVREQLKTDLNGTLKSVAKVGYQGVEFFSPYTDWTTTQAKDVRKLLDDLGMKCFSTHNSPKSFAAEGIDHAIELNQILGSKLIVMASAGKVSGIDGWKTVAENLTKGAEKMKSAGIDAGFHNHKTEFDAIDGIRPIEVLASNTPKNVVLQLDVGTCLHAGADPVAWIEKNPGRVRSMHLKDWSSDPAKGYKVLFGEGSAQWKKIFAAAEKSGVQHYLIEQEGNELLTPMATVERCYQNFKKLHS